nr:retinol dehydrogenase 12-like [Onthophagus taurus]
MFKKVVIITGANSGLGFETALELSKRGAKIILAYLASFSSIRNFVKEIYENEKKLDVLINNAGIGGIDDQLTEDGHLTMIQTVEEGSRTIIYLATSQDVKNVTGGLFENCAEIKMYKTARNPNLGIELWELSEKLNPKCMNSVLG